MKLPLFALSLDLAVRGTLGVVTIMAALIASSHSGRADVPTVHFREFTYLGDTADGVHAMPGSYRNPILAGFYPDPSVCRVGEDYYLINSSFAYFPGIPIFRSRDLVHWTQLGHVISRQEQLKYEGLGVSRGIFAPAISYRDGTFYVVCTMVDAGENFLVTAKDPAGPWSDPIWFSFEGIDPSLFFDRDGRAWIVNNGAPEGKPLYDGHRAIWIQEFDVAEKTLIGPRHVLVNGGVDLAKQPIWIEGPHLYRRGEYYYLCCAEGGTSENHSQVIFRSKSVAGPFVPWVGNPILTQRGLDETVPDAVSSTGHADLVEGPDGGWWAVFLGCRPYARGLYYTGRETFLLPVRWTGDGWPVILPAGERVPLMRPSPRMPGGSDAIADVLGLSGELTIADRFETPELAPTWITLRTPGERWWKTGGPAGGLVVTPRPDPLTGKGRPTFLARRVQSTEFSVVGVLDVPKDPNVSAGVVVFQNETHHAYLGVRRDAKGTTVFLEVTRGAETKVEKTLPINCETVRLSVTAEAGKLAFWVGTAPKQVTLLTKEIDAEFLTTRAAGGFVGAVTGPYARVEL